MGLSENDVNNYLKPIFGQFEDSFQEAWVEILERNPQTIDDVGPIVRKVRNKAIKQYLEKKYKEDSLHKPLGRDGDGAFTLESILASPTQENNDEKDDRNDDIYRKMVDFLIGEYLAQKNENLELKRQEIQLRTERLRIREETLRFKKDRYDSWRRLMEERGKQKIHQTALMVQLQRKKLELRKELALLKRQQTVPNFNP
jgi:hypothetical protein